MIMNKATDSQIGYIKNLLESKVITEEVAVLVEDLEEITKSQASTIIDALKSSPYLPKSGGYASDLVEGIYFKSDEVYKVKKSQRGSFYALILKGSSWSYDASYVRGLSLADKITREDASAFGIRTGVCAICGIPLTNLDSLAKGIGPVCEKRDW